jgi:hypothetical protein
MCPPHSFGALEIRRFASLQERLSFDVPLAGLIALSRLPKFAFRFFGLEYRIT